MSCTASRCAQVSPAKVCWSSTISQSAIGGGRFICGLEEDHKAAGAMCSRMHEGRVSLVVKHVHPHVVHEETCENGLVVFILCKAIARVKRPLKEHTATQGVLQ